MSINTLVATQRPEHRASFRDAFAEASEIQVVAYVDGLSEIEAAITRYSPDVIVLDDTLEPESANEVARILLARDPATALLLWADRETSRTLSDAIEVGMRGVLTRPLSVEEATSKLVAAAEWTQRLRGNKLVATRPDATSVVVALFGAKGGVGTSTLAVQLARLAAVPGWPCVLADFDLANGDIPSLLDLSQQRSILDLVPVSDYLNERYLGDALYVHSRTGMRVLPGPAQSERADEVTEPVARRILAALRSHFPFVIVDCGSRLDDANAVAVEVADHVLLATVPEVPSLLAARRQLATFSRLNIRPDRRVTAIVNRQSKRAELQVADIRRTLGISVADMTIPDRESAFHSATNDADPTRLDDRAVLRPLQQLAQQLGLTRAEDVARHSRQSIALRP